MRRPMSSTPSIAALPRRSTNASISTKRSTTSSCAPADPGVTPNVFAVISTKMPCPLCDDTGWKPVDDASGVRRVVRCDCWRENIGRQRLGDANIPKRYQHCTLGNFTAYNESLDRAVAQARRVADAYPVVNKGLLLEGQPGVGKTHIAVAVLKQAIQTTGARGLFYDVRDLLRV